MKTPEILKYQLTYEIAFMAASVIFFGWLGAIVAFFLGWEYNILRTKRRKKEKRERKLLREELRHQANKNRYD